VQIRADDEEKNLAQSIYVSFSEEAEPTLVASYSFPDGSQQFIDNSEIPTSSFTQSEANWFYSPPNGSDQSRPLYVLCEYSPISNKTWQEDDQGFQNKLITYDWLNKYFEKCSQNDQYSDRCQMRHQQWFVRLPDEVDPTSANTQNTEEDSSTEAADVYGDETDLDLDHGPRSGQEKNLQEDICDSNFKSNYILNLLIRKDPNQLICRRSSFFPNKSEYQDLVWDFTWYFESKVVPDDQDNDETRTTNSTEAFLAFSTIDSLKMKTKSEYNSKQYEFISCGVNFYQQVNNDERRFLCSVRLDNKHKISKIRNSDFFNSRESTSYMRWTAVVIVVFSLAVLIAGVVIYRRNSNKRKDYFDGQLTPEKDSTDPLNA